jgi:hypothetical protein
MRPLFVVLSVCLSGASLSACTAPPAPSADAATPDAALDGRADCVADPECDDGVFCNGAETCSAGRCVARTLACDDGIACTVDECDEAARTCRSEPADRDDDGFGDARCLDAIGVPLGTDCDDDDDAAFPGNTETCDAHDEDCDPTTLGGSDLDLDGALPETCCNPDPDGGAPICGRDCDDTDASISELATETCDTIDNDCDDAIDESATMMSWPDADSDGFGDESATPEIVCVVPSSRANQGGDCDDDERRVHPFQTEECNGVDDDCDDVIDEGGDAACAASLTDTTVACVDGACVVTGCSSDHFDCNESPSDGCEAALCTDVPDCGACGRLCGGGTFAGCSSGMCFGANPTFALLGMLRDAVTGAPVPMATIRSIGVCPVFVTTTAADGSFTLGPAAAMPTWVRITAAGYPTHVQPVANEIQILPSTLVDAWAADPDRAASPSATQAILVIDDSNGASTTFEAPSPGPVSGAEGSDVRPTGGSRAVYFDVVPGRATVGGLVSTGGGCALSCGSSRTLWLEAGSVTFTGPIDCAMVCS